LNGRNYVTSEVVKKVEKAVKELNYQPSLIARSLVKSETKSIGLLLTKVDSPFTAGFTLALEDLASELGYHVFISHSRSEISHQRQALNGFMERRVDGIIVNPVREDDKTFQEIIKQGIPLVLVVRTLPKVKASSVVVDNFGGSRQVMEFIIEQGFQKIAVINGTPGTSTAKLRWTGAEQACKEAGVEIVAQLIKEGNFSIEGGYAATMEILDEYGLPEAFYAANHLSCLGCLKALKERGLKITEDVSVASFDGLDDSLYFNFVEPAITSNIHPTKEMAATAMHMLQQQILAKQNGDSMLNTVQDVSIRMQLAVRDSVRKKA
jgi:LacI family transcriptional regulator